MTMPPRSIMHSRRVGSLALGLSALLLAVFPLIRPFFPLDPRAPAETLAVASPAIVSTPWVVSHLLCTLAFVLLLYGVLSLYATLASTPAELDGLWAMVLSFAGIALILPMLGVETYMLPILGHLYLAGQSGIAPAIGMIYGGPALFVFLLGLLLLAIGAITFAVGIWRSAALPRWAGVLFAIGLVLWFPPFPRVVRIIDGFLIGFGGVWLAAGLRPKT
ncbi:MAG: hypothetical protein C5B48_08625 [Candidatus Rokuibacteriota bacterium]|nr:MAG: hypothetical protein C5B48_08625 [Candidatus Rokubacteria bacterium]